MAYDAFLEFTPKVEGESTAEGMSGIIDVFSFSWGLSNATTDIGSGSSGGRAEFGPLNIMKKTDKASPVLMKACATGDHYDKARLILRKATGKDQQQQQFVVYTLTGAFISSFSLSGASGGDTTPTESLSIDYATIKFEYWYQDGKGKLTAASSFEYDLVKRKATS
jgi:type VI secretion system secreted protein Hcp